MLPHYGFGLQRGIRPGIHVTSLPGFSHGRAVKKRGTPSMCPSFTVMISDLITRVIDIFYLAPVVACVGTGAAGGAQATLIMERIMW